MSDFDLCTCGHYRDEHESRCGFQARGYTCPCAAFVWFAETRAFKPYCARCDHDAHTCPGCGENLRHGTDVCDECRREHA